MIRTNTYKIEEISLSAAMVFHSGARQLNAAKTKPTDIDRTRVRRLPLVSDIYPHIWAPMTTPRKKKTLIMCHVLLSHFNDKQNMFK